MSTRLNGLTSPIVESRDELVAYLEAGSKPKADWCIGTEHEKFVFGESDNMPIPYAGERGIGALLKGLERFDWDPAVIEQGNVIALSCHDCPKGGVISLEPGGQLELSGAPLATVHETHGEISRHLAEVKQVGRELGIGFLPLGFSPKATLAETPLMPKERYGIMMRYMPAKGGLGLDMMFRTATVQVNLDFAGEADMVQKLRVGLALQPIATALFANSPFTEGRPNGFQSYRAEVWRDTDPDRTGLLPFAFEPGMGFERYVDFALDVPMYFVFRDDRYIDTAGASFKDFLAGTLAALPGARPTLDDWADHLTTLFPDVRLKGYLEMRGADSGPLPQLCALPAFWVGLLYDADALAEAASLVADWTQGEREALRDSVQRLGLATPFRQGTVGDLARELLCIAGGGLQRRGRKDQDGEDERKYLGPLIEAVEEGHSPAEMLLAQYRRDWTGDIDKLFDAQAL